MCHPRRRAHFRDRRPLCGEGLIVISLGRGGGGGLPSLDKNDRSTWDQIELADGRGGFVRDDLVRSIKDYFACFAHLDGQWRMVRFERDVYPGG